jgi:hypothetical protein
MRMMDWSTRENLNAWWMRVASVGPRALVCSCSRGADGFAGVKDDDAQQKTGVTGARRIAIARA